MAARQKGCPAALRQYLGFHDSSDEETVKLAVPLAIVERLLSDGHLCAADVRCLDPESKRCMHRLCLQACARCIGDGRCGAGPAPERCRRSLVGIEWA